MDCSGVLDVGTVDVASSSDDEVEDLIPSQDTQFHIHYDENTKQAMVVVVKPGMCSGDTYTTKIIQASY